MSSDNIIKCDGIVNEGIQIYALLKKVAESVVIFMRLVGFIYMGREFTLIRGRRKLQPYIIARIYINFGEETVDMIRDINDKYIV